MFITIIGAGCASDSKTNNESTGPIPTPTTTPAPVNSDTSRIQPVPQPAEPTPTVVSNSASTAKLNPAHGKPGHRCDIPVGSPLDSKPAQVNSQQQPATAITPVNTTPQTPPSTAGSGINPAHGQPGHRCDIPVGSPLNSKPAQ